MTITQVEAHTLCKYLQARGYHCELHHADGAGITITISRGPLEEDLGTAPLAKQESTTPLYPGAPRTPLPMLADRATTTKA